MPTSWSDWERRARAVARTLVAAGVQKGDRVAVFGNTCEAWVVADLGILMAGATTVPIYPSLVGDQAAYILRDSGAKVLFAEDDSLVARIREANAKLVEGMTRTILFGEMPAPDAAKESAAVVDERIAAGARRRSGHARVHVRNDGAAQGRDAHAP